MADDGIETIIERMGSALEGTPLKPGSAKDFMVDELDTHVRELVRVQLRQRTDVDGSDREAIARRVGAAAAEKYGDELENTRLRE